MTDAARVTSASSDESAWWNQLYRGRRRRSGAVAGDHRQRVADRAKPEFRRSDERQARCFHRHPGQRRRIHRDRAEHVEHHLRRRPEPAARLQCVDLRGSAGP